MANKTEIIKQTLDAATLKLTQNNQHWLSFLQTAANNYKYSFTDQVLIFAQKPDATACAGVEFWNNRMNRWINKGVTGIALLEMSDSGLRLRYVFDVTDTNSRNGMLVPRWQVHPQMEPALIEALEQSFGTLREKNDLRQALLYAGDNLIAQGLPDFREAFADLTDYGDINPLSDDELDTVFRLAVQQSVQYMLLYRCGIDAPELVYQNPLHPTQFFTSAETINILGSTVSDLAETGLREIERTVRALQKEAKQQNRTFAMMRQISYDKAGNQPNQNIETERSTDNGNDVHTTRRFFDPERDLFTGRTADPRQIRQDAPDVPERAPQAAIQPDAAERHAVGASAADRPAGVGDDGDHHGADEAEPRGDGAAQGERSVALDSGNGEYPQRSGGDRSAGVGLQLSGHDFNAPSEIPYYYAPDEQNELLRNCIALKDHRMDIATFFANHEDRKERGNYIKTCFDNTYVEHILESGKRVGYRAWDDVLNIWRGSYLTREKEVFLRWPTVADHIYGQILMNTWLSDQEQGLPDGTGQFQLLTEEQNSAFVLPQAAIDYVLCGGSGISEGKFRIFEQFQRQEGTDANAKFLKNEYGIGGRSDAVPGTDFWEEHDGKGIAIRCSLKAQDREQRVVLSWPKVAKRIGELIAVDRYLNSAEKEHYPIYQQKQEERNQRNTLADSFRSLIGEYNEWMDSIQNEDAKVDLFLLNGFSRLFATGEKAAKGYGRNSDVYVLPTLRDALTQIIGQNTHLTERCEALLAELNSDAYAFMEPTEAELHPPEKEYKLSLGDRVFLGSDEFELLSLGDEQVELFDPKFPLFHKSLTRNEFDALLRENPLNDRYLQTAEEPENVPAEQNADAPNRDLTNQDTAAPKTEADVLEVLQGYYNEAFPEEETDVYAERIGDVFPLAFSTSEDGRHELQVDLDLAGFRFNFLVDNEVISATECVSYDEIIGILQSWDFDRFIGEAEMLFHNMEEKKQEEAKDLIGKEVMIEGTTFVIESVSSMGDVSMRDTGFERNTGFPINRVEKLQLVQDLLREQENAKPLAPPALQRQRTEAPHRLLPEISDERRLNFRIENDDLGVGTPLERFHHNIMAIQLLKKLESEHRLADSNEQRILSDYVGWGGLSEFFEEQNPHHDELVAVLTEEEYTAARASSLTAFYTPPVVIRAMYQALENMGFQSGNILEPSCGIGNFMGLLPESMQSSQIYGVELDSISGRIAQQLYQKNSITVQGFEDTNLPDSFYDAAIGNVPFGQIKVNDRRYNKYNFLIHDYFFARTIDKVRPGGIIAFITSSGTMDKESPKVRKYLAQRADLLGAIRLPNDTFKRAAGTEVTADILFLQKRDRLIEAEPDWVHLNVDDNGIRMNQYFIDHPEMVLGEMKTVSGPFGPTTACLPSEDRALSDLLQAAIQNIRGQITEYTLDDAGEETVDRSIPADPTVRNYSYTLVDGELYYRENSRMTPVEVNDTAKNRIKGMIGIRDCVRELIEVQLEDAADEEIEQAQKKLNQVYDAFVRKYGRINTRANESAFTQDSASHMLASLEVLDDDRQFERKADMFTKRTIRQKVIVQSVDTAAEALALSLAEKTKVDMAYMRQLTGKSEEELVSELQNVIFREPSQSTEAHYLPADEYLSGNVREKLRIAKQYANLYPDVYAVNVSALEAVQPKDLNASEISVRLGATWLPPEIVEQFMFELFQTPRYMTWNIHVHYSKHTGEWQVEGKSNDKRSVLAYTTYGTTRINGYRIIEETLNLRDVRIFDYIEEDGKKKAVLNKKETTIAQGKQEAIKEAFQDWIWKDPRRRDVLCKLYNEKFNSIRPRTFDGSHLNFVGMNPEIKLRRHQTDAIAHIIYGGNTLLAHEVGAGKTFAMVAAAQESKRLGLCSKSLFVVPNHLIAQWATEYLQLYPAANILVASKKDFETKNRKRFCARIATGDYDAIIIGHSQFEKIPMSIERQRYILQQQLSEIMDGIVELKGQRGERFSIKQLERTKKSIELKLQKLNDQSRKDDVVTFEELGIDRLFIDEAHYYKNLAAFSKMRNVGGISQTEAQKSSDLYMKCRYLDELTGGKGVVFATGTPISNSMVEMYTMQKYLQYDTLKRNELLHFDAWASTFGQTVTAIELSPEGSGYRAKTRFAKFYNLPELMAMFKEVADIQTADMLHLPVPKANFHNVVLKPSEHQKTMVAALSDRAERVRNKMVSSDVDNMLLITNDGRKLALDQRLINDALPDSETGKVAACADNVVSIWQRTTPDRSAQLVFCDLSTPHGDGKFNVYDDLRTKLIERGIPPDEIAFIHNANTEVQKKELFNKVNNGTVRVLLGSTSKMGAGTNAQQRLIALHHLDTPWRPADLAQRNGRIIRQGNDNPEVDIYTYVTENTFDSYLYQLVENKQKFIGQVMTSKSPVRSAEDVDEQALSYAEIKMLATGNPHIKEKMDLDIDVSKLKLLKANHLSQRYALEDKILKEYPQEISYLTNRIKGFDDDIAQVKAQTHPNADGFSPMEVEGTTYWDKKAAGSAILAACKAMKNPDPVPLGSYRGFSMELYFDALSREYKITLHHTLHHTVTLGSDLFGNITRLDHMLDSLPDKKTACREKLTNTEKQLAQAKEQVRQPFAKEDELQTKTARLAELNAMLNLDKTENEFADDDKETSEPEREQKEQSRGR